MSFDVFVQSSLSDYSFPYAIVEEIFRPYLTGKSDEMMQRLEFPGGGSSDLYITKKTLIEDFAVMAAGGHLLYDAIYQVLSRVPHLYMYWDGGLVVADPAVITELPQPMVDHFHPIVVHSGQEIVDAIEQGPWTD